MSDDRSARQKQALAALDRHEDAYDHKVAGRPRQLWERGELWKYDRATFHGKVPGWQERTFQLVVAPPSWGAGEAGGLDDAVVGPDGDWQHAGEWLPLFFAGEGGFIVVSVAAPHTVGWFHEENWQSDGKEFRRGVFVLADTPEAFFAMLGPVGSPVDQETDGEELWSAAGEGVGEDGDGDEDGEDD